MKKYNNGDIIRCRDISVNWLDIEAPVYLTMDKEYIVLSYKDDIGVGYKYGYVLVKDDIGEVNWYSCKYFITQSEIRRRKLKRLEAVCE